MSPDLVVYARWDGRRSATDLDPATLLAALADDLIDHGQPARALDRLLRWGAAGPTGLTGLHDLLEQARRAPADRSAVPTEASARLLDQLQAAVADADPQAVDRAALSALLGEEAGAALDRLQAVLPSLTAAGLLRLSGDQIELSPRALRQIGQRALRTIFRHLQPTAGGQHGSAQPGRGGEPGEGSRPYQFGDPWRLDLAATFRQVLWRQGGGLPLRLSPADLQVQELTQPQRSATVLALDVSRSMLVRGCFAAARRVALALQTLIQVYYPGDQLAVVTFAHGARALPPGELIGLRIDEADYGTNLEAALALARHLLRRQTGRNKQVIVVTDGEPTAHQDDERVFFSYPPHPRTLQATLREAVRCTRERIVINTFLLDRGQPPTDFVDQLTRLNRGRRFVTTPDRLGEYVLVDYIGHRR